MSSKKRQPKLPQAVRRVRLSRKRAITAIQLLERFHVSNTAATLLQAGLAETAREASEMLDAAAAVALWHRRRLGLPDPVPLDATTIRLQIDSTP